MINYLQRNIQAHRPPLVQFHSQNRWLEYQVHFHLNMQNNKIIIIIK